MLQFALAGSLHAVCNLRQFASPQSLGAGTPPFGVQVGARAVQPAHPGKPVQAATVGPLQEKEKSPNPMQSQAHAAVRPGGLTARCVQSALDLRALQAQARSAALPSSCGKGGLRGWGSWRASTFWAGKSCTFRKSRQDFQNKHVHPPPTTSPVRKNWTVDFHAISRNGCLC
jgi:hypothetical protein